MFGAKPDCPHTGYGYIEVERSNLAALGVRRFVEKPSQEVAERYFDSDDFLWNVGIFLCKAVSPHESVRVPCAGERHPCRTALAARSRTELQGAERRLRASARHLPRLRHRREGRQFALRAARHRLERRRFLVGTLGFSGEGRGRQRRPRPRRHHAGECPQQLRLWRPWLRGRWSASKT